MDGVLIDVWTSLHCLEQDMGHQAGFNKSCLRRLGRNNSNGHMHFLIKIVQEKELSDCSRRSWTMYGRCRWYSYGSRICMEVPALLKQDLGHQAGLNIIDWYQEKELFRTRWQPKLFPFLWFNFFELSCFIFLNLLTSGWCLWGSAPVLTVLGDMDGVLIDVWTSVHCLEQDLGHQAGLNKSCSRQLGRKNSNRHMHWWLRLYKKKSF